MVACLFACSIASILFFLPVNKPPIVPATAPTAPPIAVPIPGITEPIDAPRAAPVPSPFRVEPATEPFDVSSEAPDTILPVASINAPP